MRLPKVDGDRWMEIGTDGWAEAHTGLVMGCGGCGAIFDAGETPEAVVAHDGSCKYLAMTCGRCGEVGTFVVNHPGIGGKVCENCWTPADQAIVYPGSLERAARFRAACDAVGKRHPEGRCEALKDEQRIACPVHDRDGTDEEE